MQSKETMIKHVTNRQGAKFAAAARAAGVPRDAMDEFLKDEKRATVFFDQLKKKSPIRREQPVSKKFIATDTVVSTVPSGKTYNVRNDKLVATKADGGLFDYVDGDINGWFGDVLFTDNETVSGRVQEFRKNITHGAIIDEGKNLGIYQEYDIVQGLLLANELVKAGAIEKRGFGVIIYLKNTRNGNRCRLLVYRDSDGGLYVDVNELRLGRGWRAGVGVLFSN